jgi:pimeloyl-ACP methyl ester carboxylesterase/protocatechuate 3,4-dioxygenase beta subunit
MSTSLHRTLTVLLALLPLLTALPVNAQSSSPLQPTVVAPAATGEIRGTVTDAATGQPIPNVVVEAYTRFTPTRVQSESTNCSYCATTNSNGGYAIDGLPSGEYLVRFWPEETSYIPQWYGNQSSRSAAQYVTVNNAPTPGIDAALSKGGSISGWMGVQFSVRANTRIWVFDQRGEAVQTIYLDDQVPDPKRFYTTGLADGDYRLYFEVLSAYEGYVYSPRYFADKTSLASAEVISIRQGQSVSLGLAAYMNYNNQITGSIRGADTPRELSDVRVTFYDRSDNVVASDPYGGGYYGGIPLPYGPYRPGFEDRGPYKIRFEPLPCGAAADYLPIYYPNSDTLAGATPVAGSMSGQRLEVTLQRGPARTVYGICGTVNDINERPLPGITVRTNTGKEAVTDPSGFYVIDGLTPGVSYTISATGNGYIWSPAVRVSSTRRYTNFVGVPDTGERSTIAGSVFTADRQSISGVSVKVNGVETTTTGDDGSYRIEGLAPGAYTISVAKTGYEFTTRPAVNVPPDATGQDFTGTPLDGPFSISGRVADPNGDPIAEATVSAGGKSARSGSDGSFTITGLPARQHTLVTTYPAGNFNFKDVPVTISNRSVSEVSILGTRRPLIFVPGIMGSYLDRKDPSGQCNIWPGIPGASCGGFVNKNPDLGLSSRNANPIVATDAFRQVLIWPIYKPLLDQLARSRRSGGGGYQESDWPTTLPPVERCRSQYPTAPQRAVVTLFVFAYDWRQDIGDSAKQLAALVDCVQQAHGGKVDILTHSMGGLVARRYIVDRKEQSNVNKLITIAAPWLGAPRMLPVVTTGWYEPSVNALLSPADLKAIAPTMPGVWQLAPSPYYFDLVPEDRRPLLERGRDLDGDWLPSNWFENLDYAQTMLWLEKETGKSPYGLRYNMGFHTAVQDDFRSSGYGVRYTHLYGVGTSEDTIESLRAIHVPVCFGLTCVPTAGFWPRYTWGDGTVPQVSASRQSELGNYNSPQASVQQFRAESSGKTEHTALASNDYVITAALAALAHRSNAPAPQAVQQPAATPAAAYYLTILGTGAVTIADGLGNTTDTISGTLTSPVPNITYTPLSEQQHVAVLQTDQSYTVTFRAGATPLLVTVTRGTGNSADQATRFLDVNVPASTTLRLAITPQGVEPLRADSDGNGSFETALNPSVAITGAAANDLTPPQIVVSHTGSLDRATVALAVTDDDAGVKRTFYSLDGTTYTPYTGPFEVESIRSPVVYAFADDNAGNRSSLVSHRLAVQTHLPLVGR